MFFAALELQRRLFQMLLASENMHLSAVDKGLIRSAQYFLQVALGLLKLVFLQCTKARLVALDRLCMPWIFRRLFLGSYFQWHQTASSSEFSSGIWFRIEIVLRSFSPPRRRVCREKL